MLCDDRTIWSIVCMMVIGVRDAASIYVYRIQYGRRVQLKCVRWPDRHHGDESRDTIPLTLHMYLHRPPAVSRGPTTFLLQFTRIWGFCGTQACDVVRLLLRLRILLCGLERPAMERCTCGRFPLSSLRSSWPLALLFARAFVKTAQTLQARCMSHMHICVTYG